MVRSIRVTYPVPGLPAVAQVPDIGRLPSNCRRDLQSTHARPGHLPVAGQRIASSGGIT